VVDGVIVVVEVVEGGDGFVVEVVTLVVVVTVVVVVETVVSEVVFGVVFAAVEVDVEAVVVFVLALSVTTPVENFGEIRLGVTSLSETGQSPTSLIYSKTSTPSSGL